MFRFDSAAVLGSKPRALLFLAWRQVIEIVSNHRLHGLAALFSSFIRTTSFPVRQLYSSSPRTPKTRRWEFGGQWERVLTKHLHQALFCPQGRLAFGRYLFISDSISPFLHYLVSPPELASKVDLIADGRNVSLSVRLS